MLGQQIPGNMVVGVFAPQFAVRLLEASVAAGIEAPLRLYITENSDGTATLSYKTAAHVLAPYTDEGGPELTALANELDQILDQIAAQATGRRRAGDLESSWCPPTVRLEHTDLCGAACHLAGSFAGSAAVT